MRKYLLASVLLGLLSASPAQAQDVSPGSACSTAGAFNRSGGPELSGAGHFMVCSGGTWSSIISYSSTGGAQLANAAAFTADISPASIGASQDNYAPAGHATAAVMRLTASGAYNITGLQGGADGRVLTLVNIGTNAITLVDESASSTAANRFALAGNITLTQDQSAVLLYDSTSSRWRVMAVYGPGGAASAGGSDRQMQFNNAGSLAGITNFTYNTDGSLNYYYYDSTTGNVNFSMIGTYLDVAPSANQTAGRRVRGMSGAAGVVAGNTFQIRGVEGTSGYAGNAGTGAVEALTGTLGYAENTGNATVSNAVQGLYGGAYVSAGTVGTARGARLDVNVVGGTATTVQGLSIGLGQTAGTITNRYGLILETPSGTATNDFGIYQEGTQNNRLGGGLLLAGDVSPASIGASQNNYAPTGHATAAVLRLTASGAYNITGLQGGADGRILTIVNIGTNAITLVDESGSSTAANRFALAGNITLAQDQSAVLLYDSTSQRWRVMAVYGPGGAATPGGANREIQFNNAGVLGATSNFYYQADGQLRFASTHTATGATFSEASEFRYTVSPSANQTVGTSGTRASALMGYGYVPATNTFALNAIRGLNGYSQNDGSGSVSDLVGVQGWAHSTAGTISSLRGIYTGASASGGSLTSLMGIGSNPRANAGATVTNLFGNWTDVYNDGGTVTNMYGDYIDVDHISGTTTNRYGIYLATPDGAVAGNDWGIYQSGAQRNVFGGSVSIGGNNNTNDYPLNIVKTYAPATWNLGAYTYLQLNGDSAAYNGAVGQNVDIYNNITGAGYNEARGFNVTMIGANDGDEQRLFGSMSNLETHANDFGFGFYVTSRSGGQSTGGTQHGLYIDIDDPDVASYGIYQETANLNYFNGGLQLAGDLSPAAIGAAQNNYAPTGHATANVMRLTASAAYSITGLAGGVDGRLLTIVNIGTNNITLANENASSLAANRFTLNGANAVLGTMDSVTLLYDSTSSRWRAIAFFDAGASLSDLRLKRDVVPLEGASGLDAIMKINPIRFRWKDDSKDMAEGPQIGLSAQDVQAVLPHAVHEATESITISGANGEETIVQPLAVDYEALIVPLVKSVQELKAENDNLRTSVDELTRQVEELKARSK